MDVVIKAMDVVVVVLMIERQRLIITATLSSSYTFRQVTD